MLKDGGAAQGGVGGHDDGGGAAHLGQLLHTHGIGQHIAAGAAILLGEVDAHHAQLGHLLHGLHGEALLLVQLLGEGLDLSFREFAVHLADHLLLFRQMKIHFFVLLILFTWNNHGSPVPTALPGSHRARCPGATGPDHLDRTCKQDGDLRSAVFSSDLRLPWGLSRGAPPSFVRFLTKEDQKKRNDG